MNLSAYDIASRFLGTEELAGSADNAQIMAMLKLDARWPENDETPWCSGFVNYVCWILGLPRTESLLARSWLQVGTRIPLEQARVGFDVVVLQRGGGAQPGPENLTAPGHVGFFAGFRHELVEVLGGNQGNRVSLARFPCSRVLAVQRIHVEAT